MHDLCGHQGDGDRQRHDRIAGHLGGHRRRRRRRALIDHYIERRPDLSERRSWFSPIVTGAIIARLRVLR